MSPLCGPGAGSLVGWTIGGRRRYGIWLSEDEASGWWWVVGLQHPWRRVRVDPRTALVLADQAQLHAGLLRLAEEVRSQSQVGRRSA